MDAEHPETFDNDKISLPANDYMSMFRTLRLPFGAAEAINTVGPFFWFNWDDPDDGNDDPCLRMLAQKLGKFQT